MTQKVSNTTHRALSLACSAKLISTIPALAILEKLHAHANDPEHIGAHEEFIQIQQQLALERKHPAGNLFQLFKNPAYRKRLLMGFFLQAMCQTSGVLVISNYIVSRRTLHFTKPPSTYILTNLSQVIELAVLGVSGWIPLMCYGIYNSWAACLNVVNALVVDRIGRIRIITIGISGGIVCVRIPHNLYQG